jgi:hypothetical protein
MTSKFIAKPPKPIKLSGLPRYVLRSLRRFLWTAWWSVCPFHDRPEEIEGLPETKGEITDEELKLSQWIFDQAEARRGHLEQKAQSTFGLMLFLVPALVSLFVFVVSKMPPSHATLRAFSVSSLIISAALLFTGFVSAVRAISVKGHETLFIESVVDKEGTFKKYTKSTHARGLLYCAAMNEGLNDHIAQFVKGAHVMTAAAVVALVVAAVPTSYSFSSLLPSPTETKIVGPVEVASPEAMRQDVENLSVEVGKLLSSDQATGEDLKRLQEKVSKLDAKLNRLQKSAANSASKK